ncbi:zinc finger protein, putative, partial [Hepatocystis sp. ex Piliocolobus tephrosceles]
MHRFKIYKIQMCKYALINKCDRGENCTFAHDISELRIKPDMRKTKLCKSYIMGKCTDYSCIYAHSIEELRKVGKPAICQLHREGRCIKGNQCRFAHSITDINTKLVQYYDRIGNLTDEEMSMLELKSYLHNKPTAISNCIGISSGTTTSDIEYSTINNLLGYSEINNGKINTELQNKIEKKKLELKQLNHENINGNYDNGHMVNNNFKASITCNNNNSNLGFG